MSNQKNGLYGYVDGMPQRLASQEIARATFFINPVSNATVGAATLAVGDVAPGNLLRRTGSTGAYTDTLPTAAQLTAAFPEIEAGQSYLVNVSNRVAFVQTLAGGTGVTLVAGSNTTVAANANVNIALTKVSATAWTFELCS